LHSFLQDATASKNRTVETVGSKRVTAMLILKEIQKRVPQLIKQVQAITVAMLGVASLKADTTASFQKVVEKSVKKLSEESHAYGAVPMPCRSWFDYDLKPVTVHSISPEVVLLGGVHKPRKIRIVGSDGQSYFAILKGNDELRQDLVIQQSFNIINKLFNADGEARKRRLFMRTYNVVLLSPSAGILEMVCHSQSLTEYLAGPSQCPLKPDFASAGAHERYRPSDDVCLFVLCLWSCSICSRSSAVAQQDSAELGFRLQTREGLHFLHTEQDAIKRSFFCDATSFKVCSSGNIVCWFGD
jgi:hypothetical protein